jgi:hypothetical protein
MSDKPRTVHFFPKLRLQFMLIAVGLALSTLGLVLPTSAQHQPTFITFDPVGSYDTYPQCLSDTGQIPGYYFDKNGAAHGFLRSADGTITKFDVRGAGTASGLGTFPWANNIEDVITGYVTDGDSVSHGFVRFPNGTIAKFDVEGAGNGSGQGTFPLAINPAGMIEGNYVDDSNVSHGFVRAPDGVITTYDVTGEGTGASQGISPASCDGINPEGMIPGNYYDANNVSHGYIRFPEGRIATFDARGAGTEPGQGTFVLGINTAGTITGWYVGDSNVVHGFLRAPDGAITEFEAPGAGGKKGSSQGTYPENINTEGAVTGYEADVNSFDHGFVRFQNGEIITFEVPGARNPPGVQYPGTVPICNDDLGAITGIYSDSSGFVHGFLIIP